MTEEPTTPAVRSLATLRQLLIARPTTLVLGSLLVVALRGSELARGVLWVLLATNVVLGITMIVTLRDFASASPYGADPARVAAATIGASLALDGSILLASVLVHDLASMESAMSYATFASVTGIVLGVVSVFAIVSMCRAIGFASEDETLMKCAETSTT